MQGWTIEGYWKWWSIINEVQIFLSFKNIAMVTISLVFLHIYIYLIEDRDCHQYLEVSRFNFRVIYIIHFIIYYFSI